MKHLIELTVDGLIYEVDFILWVNGLINVTRIRNVQVAQFMEDDDVITHYDVRTMDRNLKAKIHAGIIKECNRTFGWFKLKWEDMTMENTSLTTSNADLRTESHF